MHQIPADSDYNAGDSLNMRIINVQRSRNAQSDMHLKDVIKSRIEQKRLFYSIEVSAKQNFLLDYTQFQPLPLFTAVTNICNVNAGYNDFIETPTFKMVSKLKSTPVLTHLTCFNTKERDLETIKNNNCLNNFLVIKGDSYSGDKQTYQYASELLNALRQQDFGRDFTLAAAGHPDCDSSTDVEGSEMFYLKQKIKDNKVNFLLTQLFFVADKFLTFLRNCRAQQITIPIIPGIYIPSTFSELKVVLNITKVQMPNDIYAMFRSFKHDQQSFYDFSFKYMTNVIRDILHNPEEKIYGFHFFTLNKLDTVLQMIKEFNFE